MGCFSSSKLPLGFGAIAIARSPTSNAPGSHDGSASSSPRSAGRRATCRTDLAVRLRRRFRRPDQPNWVMLTTIRPALERVDGPRRAISQCSIYLSATGHFPCAHREPRLRSLKGKQIATPMRSCLSPRHLYVTVKAFIVRLAAIAIAALGLRLIFNAYERSASPL